MNRIQKIWKTLKPKSKYILGVLGIATIVSQGAFAFTKLSATSPRFNFLQGDAEMLRGTNETAGETVWKDPVSGNVGDTFQGIVYYHNGVVDTTAENTRIKVTIPAKTTNKVAKLSASISADNAATITDTIIDGQIVGLSGLTVNLNQDANLALVPGSVKWFPNQASNTSGLPTALPNSQTGNEIVGKNGVNVGGVNGCWQYAGYLTFSFKTTPNAVPAVKIDKTVRNTSTNESNFVDLASATENQTLEFKIDSANTGDTNLTNSKIKDTLPADLTFVPGSMKLSKNAGAVAAVSDADAASVFATGLNVGTLDKTKHDILTFSVKSPAVISASKTVVNSATITSGSLSDSDTAKVKLQSTAVVNIVKNKDAKNLTTGQTATLKNGVKTLEAKPGDTIQYILTTQNTGTAIANSYVIKDGINDVLEESKFISAPNGGHVVATGLSGDDAEQIQYPAINIAAGQKVQRAFTVKIMDPLPGNPVSGNDFDHKLYNLYGDKVLVTIAIPTPPVKMPILHISKNVRDFTVNELSFAKSDTAVIGDSLEYKIDFSNTGNAPADQVTFSDILPAGLTYIPGTTIISINGGQEHTMTDGIVTGGVMLDTIASGDSGYIKIRVISAKSVAVNSVLVNTANLTDSGVTISDTASTTFKAPIVLATATLPRTGANMVEISAAIAAIFATATVVAYRKFA